MNGKCDILCIGSNCTRNYGDRAIYRVLRQTLRDRAGLRTQRFPLKPIHANRHGAQMPGPIKLLHGMAILPRHYYQLWRRARRARAVVIGGGNLLHDVYPLTAVQVFMCTLVARLALRRVVMFGIGAGPLDRWWARRLVGLACRMSANVTVRDSYSRGILERCPDAGVRLNDTLCRDVVFAERSRWHGRESAPLRVSFSTMMYMHPQRWPGGTGEVYEGYLARCVSLIQRLVCELGAQVVLFSNEPSEDQPTVADVYRRVARLPGVEMVRCDSIASAIDASGDAHVHIGSRLHSLIFALTRGTPAVALASHGRMRGLFTDLGAEDLCFEIADFDPGDVLAAVSSMRHGRAGRLLAAVDGFHDEAEAHLGAFALEVLWLVGETRGIRSVVPRDEGVAATR